jgi:ADP-ribose diphosphatase
MWSAPGLRWVTNLYYGAMTRDPERRNDAHLQETTVDERVVFQGSYLTFRVDTIRDPDGVERTREVVLHPGAVAIVALDGEDVLLVRQWRHATGGALLEIPAGTVDLLEDGTPEAPAVCAARELAEETGRQAARWTHLGAFWTAPGFTDEHMHLYLARDLSPSRDDAGPAPDERLDLVRMPWRAAVEAADCGEIQDAKSIVGLLRLARLADRGEL